MIKFINLSPEIPYLIFKDKYNQALNNSQKNIEAISISSFSYSSNEVSSRFVNLKFINKKEFIFFSNYKSPKSKDFIEHNQAALLIYWSNINTQIRLKGVIKETSTEFNKKYFSNRSKEKNALAISSKQSQPIDSYESVKINFKKSLHLDDLKECPDYWGGYSFTPYYFEFWEGHESRINRRIVFDKIDGSWKESYLQP